nr:MFS transporter [Enterobacter hormaechei]
MAITSDSYVNVSVREKIGYGLGDMASNLSFGFVSLFLLFFYTNVCGITAVQASLIFVIARVLDALFNICIGYVIDKTNTRYGKLRPYLLFGAVPLGVLTVLCFSTFSDEFKFYYALISYTLYCLAYTAVNTPYSAMTNTLKGRLDPAVWMWGVNLLYIALSIVLNLWDTLPMRRIRAFTLK